MGSPDPGGSIPATGAQVVAVVRNDNLKSIISFPRVSLHALPSFLGATP